MISTSSISRLVAAGNWRHRLTAVVAAGTLAAFPVAAQQVDANVPTVPPEALPALELAPDDGSLRLSIEEAIAIALERNTDLWVSRSSYRQNVFGVQGARGIFDLQLGAIVSTAESDAPTPIVTEGVPVISGENRVWNLQLSQLTPLGGVASLDWTNSRAETNSLNVDTNPRFDSNVTLGYTQPLLDGFGSTVTRNEILVAQQNRAIGRSTFEDQVIRTVQDVANGYWGLVEAREQLEVAREALALAEELHAQNEIRVDVGTLAPLELVQSEAGVATQREAIITARTAVGDAADQLRLLLNLDQGPLWMAELIPETQPDMEPVAVDLQAALDTALAERVELTAAEAELERARLDATLARSLARPTLDLDLSYDLTGLGGDIVVDRDEDGNPIAILPGGYSDALDQITGRDFEGWRVGLEFAVPLQNRAARAQRASADVAIASEEIQFHALEQQIATEVRTAARNLDSAWEQVESARASRRLQERSLEAEQKRFDNGMSTSFQVLQVQNELTAARSREVSAITGYRRAIVEYQRAVGELLEASSIRLAGPEESETEQEG